MTTIELVLLGLLIKHCIVDFFLQTPYQYVNKGTYGHPGGLLHALLHGIWADVVLVPLVGVNNAAFYALIDMVTHYHIDWVKVQVTKRYGWTPMNSDKWFWALGVDQLAHQLVYLGIVMAVARS